MVPRHVNHEVPQQWSELTSREGLLMMHGALGMCPVSRLLWTWILCQRRFERGTPAERLGSDDSSSS